MQSTVLVHVQVFLGILVFQHVSSLLGSSSLIFIAAFDLKLSLAESCVGRQNTHVLLFR